MCGRYSLNDRPQDFVIRFGLSEPVDFPLRYNIAPTQPILVVGAGETGNRKSWLVRWGLIPHWVKDPDGFTLIINARSETATTKASFRTAMRHRRVLIPASGFYEWHRPANKKQAKQAYWIKPTGDSPIAFAGLVETWMGQDGTEIDSGCILTTASNKQIGNIHHRMPVVIRPQDYDRWLDCKTQEPRDVEHLLQPVEDGFFEAIAVSDAVNKVANRGPEIQNPHTGDTDGGQQDIQMPPGNTQMDLF